MQTNDKFIYFIENNYLIMHPGNLEITNDFYPNIKIYKYVSII